MLKGHLCNYRFAAGSVLHLSPAGLAVISWDVIIASSHIYGTQIGQEVKFPGIAGQPQAVDNAKAFFKQKQETRSEMLN